MSKGRDKRRRAKIKAKMLHQPTKRQINKIAKQLVEWANASGTDSNHK